MKKALTIVKFVFVSFTWAIILFSAFSILLKIFWDFNVLNYKAWEIIAKWWQSGGNINSWQDFLFFMILLLFFPLLIIGIKRGMKINYLQLMAKPFVYFLNRGLDEEPQSVTIKNIDVLAQKTTKEEFINNIVDQRIKEIEGDNPPPSDDKINKQIREKLAEKDLQ